MSGDLYAQLGVSPDASQEQIRSAYISRIRKAHPDGGGSNEEATRLNVAYATLSDPALRSGYDDALRGEPCPFCGQSLRPGFEAESHLGAHLDEQNDPNSCENCGRLPTAQFGYRSNSGFLFWRKVYGFDGMLCRACATGGFRDFQARNITRGPWGPISFFATIFYLLKNASSYFTKRNNLAPPRPYDLIADEVLAGRPVFSRPTVLLLVVGLPLLIALSAIFGNQEPVSASSNPPVLTSTLPSVSQTTRPSTLPPTTTGFSDIFFWRKGECVDYQGAQVELVSCNSVNADGEIVDVVMPAFESCPFTAVYKVDLDYGQVACLSQW